MKWVGQKIETNDDQQTAYARTRELFKAFPDLKGFIGSSAVDVAGAGLAIEEMGLADKTAVVGTSLVSVSGQYLKTGAVDMISFWDPAEAGYAMNRVAEWVGGDRGPHDADPRRDRRDHGGEGGRGRRMSARMS